MNPAVISILTLVLATFACAFAAVLAPTRNGRELCHELYCFGIRLIGRCIAVIVIIQAVFLGLRIAGLLK